MHIIIWKFIVRPDREEEFMRAYNSNGRWAQFFSRDNRFQKTLLSKSATSPGEYVTIDYWETGDAYKEFLDMHRKEYTAIDVECAGLTIAEEKIGEFTLED